MGHSTSNLHLKFKFLSNNFFSNLSRKKWDTYFCVFFLKPFFRKYDFLKISKIQNPFILLVLLPLSYQLNRNRTHTKKLGFYVYFMITYYLLFNSQYFINNLAIKKLKVEYFKKGTFFFVRSFIKDSLNDHNNKSIFILMCSITVLEI